MEKPEYRIKAWQEKASDVLLIRTDRQADEEDYYVAGCEHVWDTHVIPLQRELDNEIKIREEYFEDAQLLLEDKRRLQSENKALQDQNKLLNSQVIKDFIAQNKITELESENKALQEKLKVSDHLKELADDAIVTLQNENKALREEVERVKDNEVKFYKCEYCGYEKDFKIDV